MMQSKENKFISVVVYLHNCASTIETFMESLYRELEAHFDNYEIVAVSDACTDDTAERLAEFSPCPDRITVVKLSVFHGLEQAMNAGVDFAIGDYIYEIDSTDDSIPLQLLFPAYQKAEAGADIVAVCPTSVNVASGTFYRIFNRSSGSVYKIKTDAILLVSRRAVNRTCAISDNLLYRKAAYAASGLKIADIYYPGSLKKSGQDRTNLAIDSLILYTNFGFRMSLGIIICMGLLILAEIIFTVVVFCTGHPIEGWTTTMLVLTFGFLGMFILLAIVIKLLYIILEQSVKKQRYRIESVEKVSNMRK